MELSARPGSPADPAPSSVPRRSRLAPALLPLAAVAALASSSLVVPTPLDDLFVALALALLTLVAARALLDRRDSERLLERLSAAEHRFRTLVEGLPLATYVAALDDRGRVVYISPQVQEILGVDAIEWLATGGTLDAHVHPDDRERVAAERRRATRSGESFSSDYRLVAPDGRCVWVNDTSQLVRDKSGRPLYAQGYLLEVTARKEAQEQLAHLAYHDTLTGLANRLLLREHLELSLARAERSSRAVALLYGDLDGFKQVNDRHGHAAGDALLRETAQRLRRSTRASEVVARLSGDEFVVLVPDIEPAEADAVAARVAQRISAETAHPVRLPDAEVRMRLSVGIAVYPRDAAGADALLAAADAAMYAAKERHHAGAPAAGHAAHRDR